MNVSVAPPDSAPTAIRTIKATSLRQRLRQTDEVAFLDIRDDIDYAEAHAFASVSVPYQTLESRVTALVPRLDVPIVLMGDRTGRDRQAARRLRQLGYRDVAILTAGLTGWSAAGGEVFWGTNVACKAFGAWIAEARGTPLISADQLKTRLDRRDDVIVIDVGPVDGPPSLSVPGALKVVGPEILYRLDALAPSPRTTIVTVSGGHARSIIMAQLLIDAGVPNPVAALHHGITGWSLQDYPLTAARIPDPTPPTPAAVQSARVRAGDLARKAGVRLIDEATLRRWRNETDRTLFQFDVRTAEEYRESHIPGFRSLPSDQALPLIDLHVGVKGARIVLTDTDGPRALITAAGLRQMGWHDVAVLEGAPDVPARTTQRATASGRPPVPPATPPLGAPQIVDGRPSPGSIAAYANWEAQLIAQIKRDALARYRVL